MNGRICLDTDIVVDHLRNRREVVERVNQLSGICLAAMTVGELLFGAKYSASPEETATQVERFIARCHVLYLNSDSLYHYAEVKYHLAVKGKPIPENDIWIAVMCIQHNLNLVTNDSHFDEVEGLHVTSWQNHSNAECGMQSAELIKPKNSAKC